jgi:hypothetical protein
MRKNTTKGFRILCCLLTGVLLHLDLLGQANPDTSSTRHVFFIHGFNVSEEQAREWSSEMFKRLHQSGMNAQFHTLSWNGDIGNPPAFHYHQNVLSAFEAAPRVAELINAIQGVKIVIAHSLGNMVISSAIQDHNMIVEKYFALNSAVPIEAYDNMPFTFDAVNTALIHSDWYDYNSQTWASRWSALFALTEWQSNLTWHGRFKDVAQKTVMYNYYSEGDEVLEIYTVGTPSAFLGIDPFDSSTHGRYAWHKQESHKGRETFIGTDIMGWGFQTNSLGITAYSALDANAAPESTLRAYPVFHHNPFFIFSATPPLPLEKERILAFGIPALSVPAGISTIPQLGNKNFDMQSQGRKRDTEDQWIWPRNVTTLPFGTRWLHSDIKNVAYFYVHPVFDSIVLQGDLL